MRILYGITKSNFGGAQRYVLELAKEAKLQGHDVAVACGGKGVLADMLRSENIEVLSLSDLGRDVSTLNDSRSFFRLLEILDSYKPDVFHINSSKMGGIGGVAGRVSKVPHIIFTSHAWAFNEPRPKWQRVIIKFLSWLTVILCHKTVCVSKQIAHDVERLPFVKQKVYVIHNGISKFQTLPKAEARERFALGLPKDVLVVGTIAELHRVKGIDILLRAWQRFIGKQSRARLVIIGGGEERKELEETADRLGISDSVLFKGFVENARNLLSGFDIFVLPSRSEALGYAILEAGIAELPVIASEVGGIPEIIDNGKTGVLVPKEDAEAIFSSLLLLEDAELRKRLGKDLKSKVNSEFSQKEMLDKTFKLYS